MRYFLNKNLNSYLETFLKDVRYKLIYLSFFLYKVAENIIFETRYDKMALIYETS